MVFERCSLLFVGFRIQDERLWEEFKEYARKKRR